MALIIYLFSMIPEGTSKFKMVKINPPHVIGPEKAGAWVPGRCLFTNPGICDFNFRKKRSEIYAFNLRARDLHAVPGLEIRHYGSGDGGVIRSTKVAMVLG